MIFTFIYVDLPPSVSADQIREPLPRETLIREQLICEPLRSSKHWNPRAAATRCHTPLAHLLASPCLRISVGWSKGVMKESVQKDKHLYWMAQCTVRGLQWWRGRQYMHWLYVKREGSYILARGALVHPSVARGVCCCIGACSVTNVSPTYFLRLWLLHPSAVFDA
jgi:hypothetical protein